MNSFKAYFKKEVLESLRQYRYLILAFGIIFFSIATPIMMKLLPEILKSQANGLDMSMFPKTTPLSILQRYINDLFQIGNMFIVFSLSSIISDEVASQKLVIPHTKGTTPSGMVIAKFSHYTLVTTILISTGFLISYNYGTILFTGATVALNRVIVSALLMSLYFTFNLSMLIALSSLFKKGITAAIITLMISYLSPLLSNIEVLTKYNPYNLLAVANTFKSSDIYITIFVTVILSIIFIYTTIFRIKKIDII